MPVASGSIAYLGAARFQGFWGAELNNGTGSGIPGTPVGAYSSMLVDGGYGAGTALTATAGDYWQVTASGTTSIDSHENWSVNDWCIYSGSTDTGTWLRLAFEDTIASIIVGDLSASDTFHLTSSADKHITFISASSTSTAVVSGTQNFTYDYDNDRLIVVGQISGSNALNITGLAAFEDSVGVSGSITLAGGVTGDVSSSARGIFTTGLITAGPLSVSGSTTLVGGVTGDVSSSARGIFTTGLITAGPLNVSGSTTLAGGVTGDVSSSARGIFTTGLITAGPLSVSGSVTIDDDVLLKDDHKLLLGTDSDAFIQFRDDATGDDYLLISGSSAGMVLSGTMVRIDGVVSASSALTASSIYVDGNVYRAGDFDTYIDLSTAANNVNVVAGGFTLGTFYGAGAKFVAINPLFEDVDFKVNQDSSTAHTPALRISGSDGIIHSHYGIDVHSGDISGSGALNIGGLATFENNVGVSGSVLVKGNTELSGTLSTAGEISGSGDLQILGVAAFESTVGVSGSITLAGGVAGDVSSSARGIFTTGLITAGPLSVSGATDFAGGVTGDVSSSARGIFTTGLITAGPLSVSGAANFAGGVTGDVSSSARGIFTTGLITAGPLSVSGATDFAGGVTTGQVSSSGDLNIAGLTALEGALGVSGSVLVQGNTELSGTLSTAGEISGSGPLHILGLAAFENSVNVSGSVVTVGGVTSTGPISGSGQFNCTGGGAFEGSLGISGSSVIGGFLAVGGVSTTANSGMGSGLNSAADVSGSGRGIFTTGIITAGPMSVSGATDFGGGLKTSGQISGSGDMNIGGNVAIEGSLGISGSFALSAVSSSGDLNIAGQAAIETNLGVSGSTTLAGGVTGDVSSSARGIFTTGLITAGPLNVSGALNFANASTLPASNGGLAAVGGTLAVSGSAIADGTVAVASDQVLFLDADGSLKRETIADFTSGIAGTGLTAASGQLALHFAEIGGVTMASTDSVMILDNGSATKRVTIAGLGTYMAGTGLTSDTGVLATDGNVKYTGSINPVRVGDGGAGGLSNDTGTGEIVYFGTGSTTAGYLYYLNTEGGWAKANAAAVGTLGTSSAGGNESLLGIAVGANPLVNGMLIKGFFDADTIYQGLYVTGAAVYIHSGTNAGLVSGGAVTTTNSYVRIVGYATAQPNVIYFNPSSTWVVNA
jgi:hypothetical protein